MVPLHMAEHGLHRFPEAAAPVTIHHPFVESDRIPTGKGFDIALPIGRGPLRANQLLVGHPHDLFFLTSQELSNTGSCIPGICPQRPCNRSCPRCR